MKLNLFFSVLVKAEFILLQSSVDTFSLIDALFTEKLLILIPNWDAVCIPQLFCLCGNLKLDKLVYIPQELNEVNLLNQGYNRINYTAARAGRERHL